MYFLRVVIRAPNFFYGLTQPIQPMQPDQSILKENIPQN